MPHPMEFFLSWEFHRPKIEGKPVPIGNIYSMMSYGVTWFMGSPMDFWDWVGQAKIDTCAEQRLTSTALKHNRLHPL